MGARGGGGLNEALKDAEWVAGFLGMSVDWVYKASQRGDIPCVQLGRSRRYRRESIEEWLRERETA